METDQYDRICKRFSLIVIPSNLTSALSGNSLNWRKQTAAVGGVGLP